MTRRQKRSVSGGRRVEAFHVRPLGDGEKRPVLKAYLDRFQFEVEGYFPVPAGSPPDTFRSTAGDYPAFELIPV